MFVKQKSDHITSLLKEFSGSHFSQDSRQSPSLPDPAQLSSFISCHTHIHPSVEDMHPSHRELTRIHYDGFCSHDFLFVFFAWSSAPSLPMKSSCSLMTWLSVISCVPRENLGFLSLCICSIFHLSLLEHPSCGVLLAWFHGCSFSRLWAS